MGAKSRRGWNIVAYLMVAIFLIPILFPLYNFIVGSITPHEELGSFFFWPKHTQFGNYIVAWKEANFGRYILNSLLYALSVTCGVLFVVTPAAYSISRFRFTGRQTFLIMLLVSQMIPQIIMVIPLFLVVKALGLYNSYISVIVTLTALGIPLPLWLLRSYFDTIPIALEEAAMVDGSSRVGTLTKIILPCTLPGVFSTSTIIFTYAWSQFMIPLIFLSDTLKLPATVGVFRQLQELYVHWELVMASTVISIIVPLVFYLAAQKYVIKGFTEGAIK